MRSLKTTKQTNVYKTQLCIAWLAVQSSGDLDTALAPRFVFVLGKHVAFLS